MAHPGPMTAPDVSGLLKVGRGCAFPGSRGLEGGGVCWEAPGGLWMELEELVTPVGWGWGGRTPSYTNNLSGRALSAVDPRRKWFIWTEGGGVFAKDPWRPRL